MAIGVGACRDAWHHLPVALGAIVTGLFVAAMPIWWLQNTSAASLSNVPLPIWIQVLAAWLVVFGSAVLSGWLVSMLFRAHRAAAVLSLAAAIVMAGAILSAQPISALWRSAACSVPDALAALAGGSLTGVRRKNSSRIAPRSRDSGK